jgi:hypothetical protein
MVKKGPSLDLLTQGRADVQGWRLRVGASGSAFCGGEEGSEGGWLVDELDAELGGDERADGSELEAQVGGELDEVFFGGEETVGVVLRG